LQANGAVRTPRSGSQRGRGQALVGSTLRVLPAGRGAWRVEDAGSGRELCATRAEAEALAEQRVRELGGGQVLVYDAYLRLQAVKRLPA